MQASKRTLRRLAAPVVVLALWSFPTSTASAQSYIFGRADFPVGDPPATIVSGDFNGDGRLDLAVVTSPPCPITCPPGLVAILLGKPDGTFGPPTNFPTGIMPSAIAMGDFNGDGKLDLVVVNQGDSTVSVLLGNGDGTFQPHVDYRTGTHTQSGPGAVAVADFNGDGKLDLAVANSDDGTVSILIGKGDGTFAPRFDYPAAGALSLATGDFNGDGKVDIVTVSPFNGATTFSVLLGNGDGSFKPPVSYQLGASPVAVAAGDLNRDGKLDLVVSEDNPNSISVLLGNGDGTFRSPVEYLTEGNPSVPLIADFNRDGKLDVAVPDSVGTAVFIGNGDGTLQPGAYYDVDPIPGVDVIAAAVGDFNGDGTLDLAMTNTSHSVVTVWLGEGDGRFPTRVDYSTATPGQEAWVPVIGDFNNDGKLDLAVPAGLDLSILLGNGDGTFQPAMSFNTGRMVSTPAVGDFNKDGRLDLAVVQPLDQLLVIYLGKGDGTFQAGASYTTGSGPGNAMAADFNGDGVLDLAIANNSTSSPPGSVSIFLGNGDGTFRPRVDYASGGLPRSMAIGDFNGDGKLDIVLANGSAVGDTLSILFGNGDGTFKPHVDITSAGFDVAAGDFNGDGKLDLVADCSTGDGLCVLLGNGDGTFRAPLVAPGIGNFPIPADVNGDGKLDLASGLTILLGNGDGTFQPPEGTALTTSIISDLAHPAVADLNGDGGLDLVMPDRAPGTINVLLNSRAIGLPAKIVFPGQGVGTTSAPVALEVSNPGSMAIAVASVTLSGANFAATNDCGASLVSGTHCNVNVTFAPTAAATVMGSVMVTDDAPGSPQAVPLIGTGVNGPFAIVSPSRLTFADQLVGTASAGATVVLTNTGNASLSMSSIAVTGANAGDFSQASTCGGLLAAGVNCKILVEFKPTQTGLRTAALTINDNGARSPQTVALTGNGTAPGVSLSPSSLGFGSELVGATTAAQLVTLTNNGDAPLAISNIAANGDFAVATSGTSCITSTPVAVGASCMVGVKFTPTAGGSRTGTLLISDDAAGSPQTLALSGTGESFSISAASGSSTSATVAAGQTATYTLNIAPTGGFNGAVSLACSGAPIAATCSVSPTSATLNGSSAEPATVTVTTMAHSMTLPRLPGGPPSLVRYKSLPLALWLMALASLMALVAHRRRRAWAEIAVVLTVVVLWAGCGGAMNNGGGGGSLGTPGGTYTLTITGTFISGQSTLKQNLTLTLKVN